MTHTNVVTPYHMTRLITDMKRDIDRLIEADEEMLVETAFMHILLSGKNKYRRIMSGRTDEFLEKITDIYPESMLDLGTLRIQKRLMIKDFYKYYDIKSIAIHWWMSETELKNHTKLEDYEIDIIVKEIQRIKEQQQY